MTRRTKCAAEPAALVTYPTYLEPSFDPKKATVTELKSILAACSIEFPLNPRALKADYVALYQTHVAPNISSFREAITKVKPSNEGIEFVATSPLKVSTRAPNLGDPPAPKQHTVIPVIGSAKAKAKAPVLTDLKSLKVAGFYASSKPIESPRASSAHTVMGSPLKATRGIEKRKGKVEPAAKKAVKARSVPLPVVNPLKTVFLWENKRLRLVECTEEAEDVDVIQLETQ